MNDFKAINVEYIRASRTIETVLVTKEDYSKLFYVYNYEGNSFRVFETLLSLINFFQNKSESDFCFNTESKLDYFLSNVTISS